MIKTLRNNWYYLFVFVLGFVLRLVPELFSSVYPAGTDIPFYIYELRLMEGGFGLDMLYFGNPLPYLILLTLRGLSGLDWLVFFKVFMPLLNGFVACSFLYFLRNGLGVSWKSWQYVLVVVLFVFSAGGVIMSNGIVKHQLAIIFFWLFLVAYKRKDFRLGLVFSCFVALSHLMVPLLLCGFLVVDWLYGFLRFRVFRWDGIVFGVLCVGLVLGVTFVVPALVAADPLKEMGVHVGSFLDVNSFGVRYNSVPIFERMWSHFVWYYAWWLGVVFLTVFQFFRNRVINALLTVIVPLGFVPFGTFWARFQWLLAYPFCVVLVGGTKSLRKLHKVLGAVPLAVFLGYIVLNGCLLAVDTTWSMPRSSVPFEDIPVIEEVFYDLNLSDDGLLLCSHFSYNWFRNFCLDAGVSPVVIDERRLVLFESGGCLFAGRDGVKGHDFYVYRMNSVSYCLGGFDSVFVVDDGYFTVKGTFDSYWGFFDEESRVGNFTVFRYNG